MDPVTAATTTLQALGYGAYVPIILAVVGLFSAVSTIYPATWPGAAAVHKAALLIGNAKPAVPAAPTSVTSTVAQK